MVDKPDVDVQQYREAHEKTHRVATVGFELLNLNWLAPAGD
jgi:hypothetical protein